MRRVRRLWHFDVIFIVAALAVLAGGDAVRTAAPATVTIVHINDAHEMDASDDGRSGGLARVATLVERLRKTHSPLLFTLGGDFLSPAAIGTARINGEPMAGRQAVAVLNLMGVQWATLGNHEFDISEVAFKQRLSESKFGIVSSNVVGADGQPFAGTVPSAVVPLRVAGRDIRLGLIGLTIDFNRRPWVTYLPAVDSARTQVQALAGKTDAIVALTHLGLAGDQALAGAVPEIDLILGGHEHENWELRRGSRATPIAKADANGRSAIVATLTFDRPGTRPDVTTRVEILNERVPQQARVKAEIARWMALGFDAFKQDGLDPEAPVATITSALDGREGTVRNRSGDLTDLDRRQHGARGGTRRCRGTQWRTRFGLTTSCCRARSGSTTSSAFFRSAARLFGRRSRDGCSARCSKLASRIRAPAGTCTRRESRATARRGWSEGKPLDPSARYRVALPEFLLTGGESRMAFLTRANPQVSEIQEFRDVRLVLIDRTQRAMKVSGLFRDRLQRKPGFAGGRGDLVDLCFRHFPRVDPGDAAAIHVDVHHDLESLGR